MEDNVFKPGFNSFAPSPNYFQDFKRPERQAGVKEAFSFDLVDESNDVGYDNNKINENKNDDVEPISPVVVTLSDAEPLAALKLFENEIYDETNNKAG